MEHAPRTHCPWLLLAKVVFPLARTYSLSKGNVTLFVCGKLDLSLCRSGFWWVLGALLFHCCLFSPHKLSPLTATRCGLSAYLLSFVLSYIIQQLQGFVSLALQSWGNNKHFSSCFHLFWNYSYFTQSNCVFFLEFNWHRTLWHDCLWHVWQR